MLEARESRTCAIRAIKATEREKLDLPFMLMPVRIICFEPPAPSCSELGT